MPRWRENKLALVGSMLVMIAITALGASMLLGKQDSEKDALAPDGTKEPEAIHVLTPEPEKLVIAAGGKDHLELKANSDIIAGPAAQINMAITAESRGDRDSATSNKKGTCMKAPLSKFILRLFETAQRTASSYPSSQPVLSA